MPNLAEHLSQLIEGLMKVHDTSDASDKLINALRSAVPSATGPVPAGLSPQAAIINHLKNLGQQLDSRLLQDISELFGIIPRLGKYEIDAGWVESVVNYHENLNRRIPFPTHLQVGGGFTAVQMLRESSPTQGAAPETRIALVGDWGVDPSYGVTPQVASGVAKRVTTSIAQHQPHYTIHLGDTYYSGLSREESGNVLAAGIWPQNTISFALNSNHEMYAGGEGYFGSLLADQRFGAQGGLSYFALENNQWLIIGLDTAYFARWSSRLYEKGTLAEPRDADGTVQRDWLHGLLRDPQHAGKRVIILTHHDGFNVARSGAITVNTLWTEMTGCLRGQLNPAAPGELIGVHDWWWYWGHVHAPIVYERVFFQDNSAVSARCAGHGAIPYYPFPRNYIEMGDGTIRVKWAETEPANAGDGTDPKRALNGYVLLTLTGRSIVEEFYNEHGRLRWSSV
jgi:hypothetical protein